MQRSRLRAGRARPVRHQRMGRGHPIRWATRRLQLLRRGRRLVVRIADPRGYLARRWGLLRRSWGRGRAVLSRRWSSPDGAWGLTASFAPIGSHLRARTGLPRKRRCRPPQRLSLVIRVGRLGVELIQPLATPAVSRTRAGRTPRGRSSLLHRKPRAVPRRRRWTLRLIGLGMDISRHGLRQVAARLAATQEL